MLLTAVHSAFPFAPASGAATKPARAYALVDLGTVPDGAPLLPVALNDAGDVCVAASGQRAEGIARGFILRGKERIPAGVGFGQAPVRCVSSNGLAAGANGNSLRAMRAWASHLGVFGAELWPDSISFARGINAAGVVAGNVLFDAGEFMLSRAFIRAASGHARFLTPPHGGTTTATAINDAGDIAFNATPLGASLDDTRAWCLRNHCYHAITGLGGQRASATAITPLGRVVGSALTSEGTTHAFLWEEGCATDLGTIDNGFSEALAANDERTVVGRITFSDGGRRAFCWTPAKGMSLLENETTLPRGWTMTEAVGINRHGEIIGLGVRRGNPRGFWLRPRSD